MTSTSTIYDIIPQIEKELIKLLERFLKADDGRFHTWEIAVFVPACNAFIHNIAGVNDSLRADNYIAAITNFRSAMESLAAIAYDGVAQLTEDEYRKFIRKGRFYKKEGGRRVEVGPREMVRVTEEVLGIKIVKTYDECCSIVHFSSEHMSFLGRFTKQEERKKSMQILLGSRDHIPVVEQKKLIESTADLATHCGRCIVAATKEKDQRRAELS